MEFAKRKWTKKEYTNFVAYLDTLKDNQYAQFSKKIIHNAENILGIKTPILKKIAQKIVQGNYKSFLSINKNDYYEETLIEGLVIGYIKEEKDFDLYLDAFVKKINTWSICDIVTANMKIIRKHREKYFPIITKYAKSKEEYVVRFALVCLLDHYKDRCYINSIFKIINSIQVDTYYVNMAIAWLLCEMFIRYKQQTIKHLDQLKINAFTYNKFISKCCDSFRVRKQDKKFLKNLKK